MALTRAQIQTAFQNSLGRPASQSKRTDRGGIRPRDDFERPIC